MKKIKSKSSVWACIALTSVFLVSCKILHSPRIKADEKFAGVNTMQQNDMREGTQKDFEHYIIIHGIGEQEDDYSRKMIKRLSQFSYGKKNVRYRFYRWSYEESEFIHDGTTINSEQFKISNDEPNVDLIRIVAEPIDKGQIASGVPDASVFYAINWSVAVNDERKKLETEEFKTFQPFYFGINKFLKKTVMVKKVADAFNGSEKKLVEQLYQRFLNTVVDTEYPVDGRINLISGSFGSQLFLGCLSRAQRDYKRIEPLLDETDDGYIFNVDPTTIPYIQDTNLVKEQVQFTKRVFDEGDFNLNMYMLTNQTNLMDKNIDSWFDVDSTNYKRDPLKIETVQITALRNPNDLLSYYFPETAADNFFGEDTRVNVSNAYYFNWPIRNDVASAHTAVFRLKKLAKAIWEGDQSGWVKVK